MGLAYWIPIIVTLLLGLIAIYYAYKPVKLKLEESKKAPILEVPAMDLINATEVDVVGDTDQKRNEWKAKLEWYEAAKSQWQERQERIKEERAREPLSYPSAELFVPGPQDPRHFRNFQDYLLIAQQDYDGPIPNKVLRVTLANKGKATAKEVSGLLCIDTNYLQPLDFPGLDGDVEDKGQGICKVNLYISEVSSIEENPTFDIAVLVKATGTTNIKYTFATPQGDSVNDTWRLNISA